MDLLLSTVLALGVNITLLQGHQKVIKVFNKRTTYYKEALDKSFFQGFFLLSRGSPYFHHIVWALVVAFQVPFFIFLFKHYQGEEDDSDSGVIVGELSRRCIQFLIAYVASTALWQFCYGSFFTKLYDHYNLGGQNPPELIEATSSFFTIVRMGSVFLSFANLTFGVIFYAFTVVDFAKIYGHNYMWSMHVWFVFFAIYYVSVCMVELVITMYSPTESNSASVYAMADLSKGGKGAYAKLQV